jgi:hypothetical protein
MVQTITPARIRHTVFTAVGIAILATAFLFDRGKYADTHEILVAVGVVIASVSLLELVFHLAGGNPVEQHMNDLSLQVERLSFTVDAIENARRLGVREMHDCAGNYGVNIKWLDVMERTQSSMDLMGRTLHQWVVAPELEDILINKITTDNVSFRWLIMSPDNQHLPQLEEDGLKIGESLKNKILTCCRRLQEIKGKLPIDKRTALEIRTFSHVPLYCSTLRVDNSYFVTPYLQSVGSRDSPLFVIEGRSSPWAIAYDREFETIWTTAVPLPA